MSCSTNHRQGVFAMPIQARERRKSSSLVEEIEHYQTELRQAAEAQGLSVEAYCATDDGRVAYRLLDAMTTRKMGRRAAERHVGRSF